MGERNRGIPQLKEVEEGTDEGVRLLDRRKLHLQEVSASLIDTREEEKL